MGSPFKFIVATIIMLDLCVDPYTPGVFYIWMICTQKKNQTADWAWIFLHSMGIWKSNPFIFRLWFFQSFQISRLPPSSVSLSTKHCLKKLNANDKNNNLKDNSIADQFPSEAVAALFSDLRWGSSICKKSLKLFHLHPKISLKLAVIQFQLFYMEVSGQKNVLLFVTHPVYNSQILSSSLQTALLHFTFAERRHTMQPWHKHTYFLFFFFLTVSHVQCVSQSDWRRVNRGKWGCPLGSEGHCRAVQPP